ncbi:MAG: restriction endonuclease subunit S [Nostoc sp.]|uniref:restriction endonuclease subunit S n=1 Tax=Nostoc sp. TaxID=1180 RepID=UPI002FF88E7E
MSNTLEIKASDFKKTEIGQILKSWEVKGIMDCCSEVFLGLTTKVDYVESGGIPLIRAKDINKGYLSFTEARCISVEQHRELTKYRQAQRGDVLITKSGTLGICAIVDTDKEFSIYESIIVLKPKQDEVLPHFLLWLMRSGATQKRLLGERVGSTVGHLNLTDFRCLQVPIPPLNEQNKIAEILSSVDEAIASTQAVIDQTRKVKQGLLQQLLTRGIGHTRFKKSAIGRIPEEWTVKLLQNLATIQTGLAKGKKIQGDSTKLPYLRVANVQDGYLDLSEIKMIEIAPKDIDRYSLKPGDLLLTEGGDLDKLGRGDIWQGQIKVCLHQNHIFAVRPNPNVLLPEFLAAQTGSSYGKEYFLNCGKQTTNLASINSTQLKNFPIILPPINEQKEIIKVLNSIRSNELTVVQELESLQKLKRGLMQDLLTGRVRVGVTP